MNLPLFDMNPTKIFPKDSTPLVLIKKYLLFSDLKKSLVRPSLRAFRLSQLMKIRKLFFMGGQFILSGTVFLFTSCYQNQGFSDFYQNYQTEQEYQKIQEDTFFLNPQALLKKVDYCQDYQEQLLQYDVDAFSPKNRQRYQQIWDECTQCLIQLDRYFSDPSTYNMGGQIKAILSQKSMPIKARLEIIQKHLIGIEAYYKAGKLLLSDPLPNKTQLGAQMQLVALQFFNSELKDSIDVSNLSQEQREALYFHLNQASLTLKDYLAFCESLYFEYQDSLVTN